MRCIACGVEMQLISAVPDQSMMLSGQELRTFECPHCHRSERTLTFTRTIKPLPTERIVLSSPSRWRPAVPDLLFRAARQLWARVAAASQSVMAALRDRSVP
jgi:hypothetical protein